MKNAFIDSVPIQGAELNQKERKRAMQNQQYLPWNREDIKPILGRLHFPTEAAEVSYLY